MATFECKVYKLTIETHNNADALELAVVGDYRSIVMKGAFKTGDLGVYIPEAAIVPEWLIAQLGLEGRLAGKAQNRVKAIKLRGVLSQGLIVPVPSRSLLGKVMPALQTPETVYGVKEGDDVTEFLGITKYEPVIPSCMDGEVFNAFGYTINYDIENIKKFPNILNESHEVSITEKIHGTWTCFGWHPDIGPIITSKGISAKGLVFEQNEANDSNIYIRTLKELAFEDGSTILDRAIEFFNNDDLMNDRAVYLLGEIFGRGVQDLHYGNLKPIFRLFDIYVGTPGEGYYVDPDKVIEYAEFMEIDTVPMLYRGPFSKEIVDNLTDGREAVSGKESNVREGIVIRPLKEFRDPEIGRVILKSVSGKYLLRKGGTEFN